MFHLHHALRVCVSHLVRKAALLLCFTCTLPCMSVFHFWCERRRCACVSLAPCPARLSFTFGVKGDVAPLFHLHHALLICVSLLVQKAALRLCFTCTPPCTSVFHFWCERRRCACVSLAPCPARLSFTFGVKGDVAPLFHLHHALLICVSLLVQKAALRLCFTCTPPCTSVFHFWCERRRCACDSLAPCLARMCFTSGVKGVAAPVFSLHHALHICVSHLMRKAALRLCFICTLPCASVFHFWSERWRCACFSLAPCPSSLCFTFGVKGGAAPVFHLHPALHVCVSLLV